MIPSLSSIWSLKKATRKLIRYDMVLLRFDKAFCRILNCLLNVMAHHNDANKPNGALLQNQALMSSMNAASMSDEKSIFD